MTKHLFATAAAVALLAAGSAHAAEANIQGFTVRSVAPPKCAAAVPAPPVMRATGDYYASLVGTVKEGSNVITDPFANVPWLAGKAAYAAVTPSMTGTPAAAVYQFSTPQTKFYVRWGSVDGNGPTSSNRLELWFMGSHVATINGDALTRRLGQPAYHPLSLVITANGGRRVDTVVAQTNVNAFEHTLSTEALTCN